MYLDFYLQIFCLIKSTILTLNKMQKSSINLKRQNIQIFLVGSPNSGKTSLYTKIKNNKFYDFVQPTIGYHIQFLKLTINNRVQTVELWDTQGFDEKNPGILSIPQYKKAKGFIVMYDITDEMSFVNVKRCVQQIKDNCFVQNQNILLIGNKKDKTQNRQVGIQQGMDFSGEQGIEFRQISVKALDAQSLVKIIQQRVKLLAAKIIANRSEFYNQQAAKNIKICKNDIENNQGKGCWRRFFELLKQSFFYSFGLNQTIKCTKSINQPINDLLESNDLFIVGSNNSGKESFCKKIIHRKFVQNTEVKIGVDCYNLNIQTNGKKENIKLNTVNYVSDDCISQYGCYLFSELKAKKAKSLIIMYDITDKSSYQNAKKCINQTKSELQVQDQNILLIGNKKDLFVNRQVPIQESLQYAQKQGIQFLQISVKQDSVQKLQKLAEERIKILKKLISQKLK